jgi:Ankyrin repeats (3 copies)
MSNRFRWAFCQLDVLRHCLPPSVRRTLGQLPESLDETYERVLKEIKKPNRDYARRLLQCLVVTVRPLRVEELAEVIAFDFDDVEGLPKLNTSWRWDDQEQALLSSCSSLIDIVVAEDSRVVQFSHFSVKEFLTSPRLSSSSGDVSCYHVGLEPAHTILAQACLSVLLQLDDRVENDSFQQSLPLTQYAAEHWTSHAQFKDVSTRIHKGMEYLFDSDKPHFSAWLRFYNIDTHPYLPCMSTFFQFTPNSPSQGGPLYYASLCGFHDLAKYLIVKYPEQVNTCGGYYVIPLLAALSQDHFQTAELLYHSGADPNVRGYYQKIPLHSAAFYGNLQMVKQLVKYNADISAQDRNGRTPLHEASRFSTPDAPNVVRLLLDHGAGVNARTKDGSTPLHDAAREGLLEVVRVLLGHGADVQAENNQGKTPLQVVSRLTYSRDRDEVMKLLRGQDAKQ